MECKYTYAEVNDVPWMYKLSRSESLVSEGGIDALPLGVYPRQICGADGS